MRYVNISKQNSSRNAKISYALYILYAYNLKLINSLGELAFSVNQHVKSEVEFSTYCAMNATAQKVLGSGF